MPKKSRKSKKAMEIQTSFLVVIIISIVIFGSGLYLVQKFFGATTQFQEQIDAQTQSEIERRMSESGDKVSIPINKKEVNPGLSTAFGVGILNTIGTDAGCKVADKQCKKMGVAVKFVKAVDTKFQNTTIDSTSVHAAEVKYINANWLPSQIPPVELALNQLKVASIPVRVANMMSETLSTRRGTTYIFNVCVYKDYPTFQSDRGEGCVTPTDDFIKNNLHGQKVLKLYVVVP